MRPNLPIPDDSNTVPYSSKCHECRHEIDTACLPEGFSGKPPEGTITICAHCGAIGIFDPTGDVRGLRADELASLQKSPIWPELSEVQEFYAAVRFGAIVCRDATVN